ncbi:MAG: hypothetical protein QXL94_07685 [Candidatus Parvarchaeum sp.]
MNDSKNKAVTYSISTKLKYIKFGFAALIIITSILVFFAVYPKISSISYVPTTPSTVTITGSTNYNYLFAVNYAFVGFDIVIGISLFFFGIISFIALFKHKKDNAPIVAMILNLNRSNNPFSMLLLASAMVLLAIISFFVSILTSYSTVSFLLGVILGTIAFLLVALSLISLSLKHLARFAFNYD